MKSSAYRLFLLSSVTTLLAFPLACQVEDPGGDGDGTTSDTGNSNTGDSGTGTGTTGETTACEGDCPVACDGENPCETGSYCSYGTCTFDCVEDIDCATGKCGISGRCEIESKIYLDPIKTDPTGDGDGDGDIDPPKCVEGEVEFEPLLPQVWLLMDRSGSMGSALDNLSRWDSVGVVLFGDPTAPDDRGVVGNLEDRVAFGASFYTSGSGSQGCALSMESVALAGNNYSAIRHRFNKLSPSGGTPTADAVAAVVADAKRTDLTGGPKILVLGTDGAPGGCRPDRTGAATTEVEKEVALAFDDDIQTFAISIDTGTDSVHMQRVANLGVGLQADADPPAPFYTAESQQELSDAFLTIIDSVPRSCVFSLNGTVDEEKADEGTVILAGTELIYEDPDGWTLPLSDRVELLGAACDQVRAGEEELDISFPCSVFQPIIR